ncbi:MAG: pyruvoyl-dependent arginine decarboxylase [Bacteroidales bacterium]
MQDILSVAQDRSLSEQTGGIFTGNRIPSQYFETTGTGESDIAIHAGSYHLALKAAHIEMCNIMTYSSILPEIASRIDRPDRIIHGAVLESIMSVCNAGKGQQATAGIIYAWLFDRENGEKFGGLVCEHEGNYDLRELERRLKASLEELYREGYSDHYLLGDPRILSESFIPRKAYGTALTALCFTSYYHPIIKIPQDDQLW